MTLRMMVSSVELLRGHVTGLPSLLADALVNGGRDHQNEEEQNRVLDHRGAALIANELTEACCHATCRCTLRAGPKTIRWIAKSREFASSRWDRADPGRG